MLSQDAWCVIENAGYVGEVNVGSFDSHSKAAQYIDANYTQDEVSNLHVEISYNDSYEY